MTLNEPASSDPFRLVSNYRNSAQHVDFVCLPHTQVATLAAQFLPIDLTEQVGHPYNTILKMRAKCAVFSCLLVKPESEDKRPKSQPFDGPKFLSRGSSARLQGTQKKLRVAEAVIV